MIKTREALGQFRFRGEKLDKLDREIDDLADRRPVEPTTGARPEDFTAGGILTYEAGIAALRIARHPRRQDLEYGGTKYVDSPEEMRRLAIEGADQDRRF